MNHTLPISPFTRRQFLAGALAAGALAGAPSAASAGAHDRHGRKRKPRRRRIEKRTFFFDLSHEAESGSAAYYLLAGGTHVPLQRVADHPVLLKRHRRRNAFLRGVPDEALTHFVEDIELPTDAVTASYVKQNPDPASGTWNMSAMYFHIPSSAIVAAYRWAGARFGPGPLPLSAKRKLYAHPPAASAQDLLEEAVFLSPADHAQALVGMHPDLLSVEPGSAAHVHTSYIGPNGATLGLAVLLQAVGPATPQETPGQPNGSGWATLTPILQDSGQPFRNQRGQNAGLIQYHAVWSSAIVPTAHTAVSGVIVPVKDDATLGDDVTGLDPSAPPSAIAGALWKRHDGVTTIDQSPGTPAAAQGTLAYTLTTQNTESGYSCTGSAVAQSGGSVQATLTFKNWFVRWLGIYLLFLDANGHPVDPTGTDIKVPPGYDSSGASLSQFAAEFALLLGPEFTVLGIPVEASTATVTYTIPAAASTVRVFASGVSLHLLSGVDPNDPSTWGDWFPGAACTVLLNYGLTMLLMAAGASGALAAIQKAALDIAAGIITEVVAVIGDSLRNQDFSNAATWAGVGLAVLKTIITVGLNQALRFGVLIGAAIAEGSTEDAIPIAGQIMQAISVVAGGATLLETTIEIAESPTSYVYDLALTHDITVNVRHDVNNDRFPTVADYYKVTALFDKGSTPHTQMLTMPPGPVSTLPPVVFPNVPRGGHVNVSVGFYSRSSVPDQNDWLAAQGTTGLVDNTVDSLPDITITQHQVPIQSTTVYEHRRKIVLADAQGTHGWLTTSEGPTTKRTDIACESMRGALCDFRSITVRQGTAEAPGYVGYAWKAYSSGLTGLGCDTGGVGQFDQLANIGGINPQAGYATGSCVFPDGARLTYSLLTQGPSNFYLDSTSNIVRQVQLDPTVVFDAPANQRAWGALNLESTALLLHPSGRLVSINSALGKIEVLTLPDAPMDDAAAKVKLLAQVHAGRGSRPGLLQGPAAAAISPDGVILVLESQNNRIQAFDLGANSVQFFRSQPSPYFLALDATNDPGNTIYLDLAVEYTGYLYVLSYNQSESSPTYNTYRLDVYHPAQSDSAPISTTLDVNAARLTVDFWRNVYTLNYEALRLPGGGVPAIAEPSISLWTPSVPSGSAPGAPRPRPRRNPFPWRGPRNP